MRLLALSQHVSLDEARGALSPASLADLEAAGLLMLQGDEVSATSCLIPQDGLLLAGTARLTGTAIWFTCSPIRR